MKRLQSLERDKSGSEAKAMIAAAPPPPPAAEAEEDSHLFQHELLEKYRTQARAAERQLAEEGQRCYSCCFQSCDSSHYCY